MRTARNNDIFQFPDNDDITLDLDSDNLKDLHSTWVVWQQPPYQYLANKINQVFYFPRKMIKVENMVASRLTSSSSRLSASFSSLCSAPIG